MAFARLKRALAPEFMGLGYSAPEDGGVQGALSSRRLAGAGDRSASEPRLPGTRGRGPAGEGAGGQLPPRRELGGIEDAPASNLAHQQAQLQPLRKGRRSLELPPGNAGSHADHQEPPDVRVEQDEARDARSHRQHMQHSRSELIQRRLHVPLHRAPSSREELQTSRSDTPLSDRRADPVVAPASAVRGRGARGGRTRSESAGPVQAERRAEAAAYRVEAEGEEQHLQHLQLQHAQQRLRLPSGNGQMAPVVELRLQVGSRGHARPLKQEAADRALGSSASASAVHLPRIPVVDGRDERRRALSSAPVSSRQRHSSNP